MSKVDVQTTVWHCLISKICYWQGNFNICIKFEVPLLHRCSKQTPLLHNTVLIYAIKEMDWWGARWLSGRVSDSGARGRGSKPTAAVLCPWARHFAPRKYWLITQEAVAPSRHDWKIVDWDVKPQHKQTKMDWWPWISKSYNYNCIGI